MRLQLWWLGVVLLAGEAALAVQTCETSLIQLRRGALELENRLSDCLKSTSSSPSTPCPTTSSLPPPPLISCDKELAQLQQQADNAQLAALQEQQLDLDRATHLAVHALNTSHTQLVAKIEQQSKAALEAHKEREAQLKQEIQALQDQLAAVMTRPQQQQPQLNLDWTSHLANLSMVLGVTEERMHEMSVKSLVYLLDDETAGNEMSGYLTWSILLLPALMSCCLLVRVKLSLERMVMWFSLYCSLVFLCLFAFSLALGHGDAVASNLKGGVRDVLVVLLLVGQLVLLTATLVLTLKQWLVEDRGGLRVRHLLQLVLPAAACMHYFQFYFYGAILDIHVIVVDDDETVDGDGDKDEKFSFYTWLFYSLAYVLLCACVALSHLGSKAAPSAHPTPAATSPSAPISPVIQLEDSEDLLKPQSEVVPEEEENDDEEEDEEERRRRDRRNYSDDDDDDDDNAAQEVEDEERSARQRTRRQQRKNSDDDNDEEDLEQQAAAPSSRRSRETAAEGKSSKSSSSSSKKKKSKSSSSSKSRERGLVEDVLDKMADAVNTEMTIPRRSSSSSKSKSSKRE